MTRPPTHHIFTLFSTITIPFVIHHSNHYIQWQNKGSLPPLTMHWDASDALHALQELRALAEFDR